MDLPCEPWSDFVSVNKLHFHIVSIHLNQVQEVTSLVKNLSKLQETAFILSNIPPDMNDMTKTMLFKLVISALMSLISLGSDAEMLGTRWGGAFSTLDSVCVRDVLVSVLMVMVFFLHTSPYSSSHHDCHITCLRALRTKDWCFPAVAAVFQDTSLPRRAWWKPSSTAGNFWAASESQQPTAEVGGCSVNVKPCPPELKWQFNALI